MLTRLQKEELVKKLLEQIKTSKVAVFSDYSGTSVGKMKKLRDELQKNGASYKIAKKRLLEIAFKEAGIEVDVKNMQGQVGVAIGQEDEVSAAKVLQQFSKENKNFKVLQGILEGKILTENEVQALASLPSREELLAKLVGSINAPVSGFVNVLAGNLRNLVGVLKAISDGK
jgi:large subunit ribosomal protein L10